MEANRDEKDIQATQNKIADYHDDIRKIELEGHELRVKKARNALFLAAGLILIAEVIVYARSVAEPEFIGISFIVGIVGLFVGLALWTKKKPFTAIVSGIIFFTVYILFVAVINGYLEGVTGVIKGLLGGWIFKVFIFVTLIRHLKDAKELQKALDEKAA